MNKVKATRKPVERVIYDNYNLDEMWNDAKESLIEHLERENPTDSEIWEEIYLLDSFNWDEEKARMEETFSSDKTFIAVGTCGLWTGQFPGGFIFSTLGELMDHLVDCEYFRFWDVNGHFHLKASHHDGTHFLEVKELTPRGVQYHDNWHYNWSDKRSMQEVYERLFADSHYSRLINFAHNHYGCPLRQFEKGDVK